MRSWKFWAFVAAVALLWWVIAHQSIVSDGQLDTGISFGIAVACLLAATGMMVVRRNWTERSLGIFGLFLGTGLLYLAISEVFDWWQFPLSDSQLNGLRSVLLTAGVLFNLGFWRWAIGYNFDPRRDEDLT